MKKILSILFLALSIASHGQLKIPFSTLPVATGNQDSTKFVALTKTGNVLANKVVYGIDLVKNYLKISDSSNMLAPYARAFDYYRKAEADGRFNPLLVSGTNIKTVNGNSLIGPGDITISGGGSTLPSVTGQSGKWLSNNGTSAQWLYGPSYLVNVKDYGAVADAITLIDASMSSGTSIITSPSASFVSGDVGKTVAMEATGNSSTDQVGTISSVTNSTTIVVSFTCNTPQSNRRVTYGTDNTTAVRNAVAAATNTVAFPEGNFFIKDSIGINKTLNIVGAGGGVYDFTGTYAQEHVGKAVTKIVTNNWTQRLFSVNATNVNFKDIAIENAVSNTTGGAGIYFWSGIGFRLSNIFIKGFWINVDMQDAVHWSIDRCFFAGAHDYGLHIKNTINADDGDWAISNSWFYADYPYSGIASIYQESSGGGKITNCKFNWNRQTFPQYHFKGNISGTVDLQISNCSFENFTNTAIQVTSPANFYNLTITGCQFASGRANTKDIDVSNTDNINISGNVFGGFDATSQAVIVAGTKQWMANNTYGGYTGTQAPAPYAVSYSNSVQPAMSALNFNTSTSASTGANYSMTGATNGAFIGYFPANYDTAAYQNMMRLGTKVFGASVEIQTGAGYQVRKIGNTTPYLQVFNSSGNVGIGATTDLLNAPLFINSAGFLVPPRMTNSTITGYSNVPEGGFAYDLTNKVYVYNNGTALVTLGSGSVSTSDNNLTASGGVISTKKAPVTLTDGATITWDVSTGYNAKVTLAGNRTLAITNPQAGQYYKLTITQDGTGSRTITLPSGSKVINGGSGAVTLSTAAGTIDILMGYYDGTNYFWTLGKNYN
jgi:hypothetical protein